MSQTTAPTVLTGPSQGVIVDLVGIEWQISDDGTVLVDGKHDADTAKVVQLAFVDGHIWRQTAHDLHWSSKVKPADRWSKSTSTSPLQGAANTDAAVEDDINRHSQSILRAIAGLKADFDAWTAEQPPSPTPTQLLAAIHALKTDVDDRDSALLSQLTALTAGLGLLLSGQKTAVTAATSYHTTVVALLDQSLAALTTARASAASDQDVLVRQLNSLQMLATTDHATVTASLSQIVDAVTGPQSPRAGIAALATSIATLQADFTNLATTLNGIVIEINDRLQQILLLDDPAANAALIAKVTTILVDVQQILALLLGRLKPADLLMDIEDATHSHQVIPPVGE